jgi:hypothetical protein
LSIDTIALCLFQIYAQSQPVYIYILTRNCFYIINIISAAINILTSIYYIKLSVFFIIWNHSILVLIQLKRST